MTDLKFDDENGEGQPGQPGQPGTSGHGGAGGMGGAGGSGGFEGGLGGMGGPGGAYQKALNERNILRHIVTLGVVISACGALFLGGFAIYKNNINKYERTYQLCVNQHAIIEMQRLFLKEHAHLRAGLSQAGVYAPNDPKLLSELNDLIEKADCDPDNIKDGG